MQINYVAQRKKQARGWRGGDAAAEVERQRLCPLVRSLWSKAAMIEASAAVVECA